MCCISCRHFCIASWLFCIKVGSDVSKVCIAISQVGSDVLQVESALFQVCSSELQVGSAVSQVCSDLSKVVSGVKELPMVVRSSALMYCI